MRLYPFNLNMIHRLIQLSTILILLFSILLNLSRLYAQEVPVTGIVQSETGLSFELESIEFAISIGSIEPENGLFLILFGILSNETDTDGQTN